MKKVFSILALVALTFGMIPTSVSAYWVIDLKGNLSYIPNVLGDDDNTSGKSTETKPIELKSPEPAKTPEPLESQKQATEIRQETEKKIMEQKRGTAKFHLESAGDGKLKVREDLKDKMGKTFKQKEFEIKDHEKLSITQPSGHPIEVEALKSGELEIGKGKFKGHTNLPLSVNANNELTITRPDGTTKVVSVLPDEAVAKMAEHGITTSPDNVELTTNQSGETVYQIKQEESKKVFGIFAMKFNSVSEVSATDSSNVTTSSLETSPWRRFLERLAK